MLKSIGGSPDVDRILEFCIRNGLNFLLRIGGSTHGIRRSAVAVVFFIHYSLRRSSSKKKTFSGTPPMKLVHGDWCLCFRSEEFFYLPASDALQRISGSPYVIWILDFCSLHALNVLLRTGGSTYV